jgi:hypothetical protein
MKKILVLLLLLPVAALSQKIKIKGEKVLFDDKEVCLLKKTGNDYVFSSLDNTKQFTARYNQLLQDKEVVYQWLTVTSPDGTQTSEVPYEVLQMSFDSSKIVTKLLSDKYGLIDTSGINLQKLQEFYTVKRENLSDKYIKGAAEAKEEAKANQAVYATKIAAVKPFVKGDNTVVSGGQMGTKIMGKIIPIKYNHMGANQPIHVIDLDGVNVADAEITGNMNNDINVSLFNGTTFTYKAKRRYTDTDNALFLTQLVEELVARDIVLGHQARQYTDKMHAEKVKLAKERSANIYKKPGYAIDEKGVNYKGTVTALFQKLDINQTGDIAVTDAIDNYGKKVTVVYLNEKGKERTVTLNASDNTRFCVTNTDGTETCYMGMKVKGDALKKLSNAMSLGFTNAYFYQIVYEDKGNLVLKDAVEADVYVVKLKDKKEGQMIDGRKNEKLAKELAEYFAGCKAVVSELSSGKLDLKVQDNLIALVKEYNACK